MEKRYQSNIELIKEAAESLSYTATYLPGIGRAKRLLVSNGKKMYIANSTNFGFYPEVSRWHQHLFDKKILTQEVLKVLGYNTITSLTVRQGSYPTISALCSEVSKKITQYPVIVKPENGARGRDISIAFDKKRLVQQVKALYQSGKSLLIQPVLSHDEYRILVINSTVEVVHMKQLNHIVGDGVQTIRKLLEKKHNGEKDETFVKHELKKRGLTLKSVLAKGDIFLSHLTRFSSPDEYYESKEIPEEISVWAKKLVQTLSIPTIGIDIFAPNGLMDTQSYIIIELNANPAFEYFHKRYDDSKKPKEIAIKFLKHYFEK
jgi:D-alanine-D-alanine ligase-like ATP-grasp enzyme